MPWPSRKQDTLQGPTIGTIERTLGMNPFEFKSKNALVTGTIQTEILRATTRTYVWGIHLFNAAGTATTHTLRKKMATATDSNEQRLTVAKSIAANTADVALMPNAPYPVIVLESGEALYITASQANGLVYNLSYSVER